MTDDTFVRDPIREHATRTVIHRGNLVPAWTLMPVHPKWLSKSWYAAFCRRHRAALMGGDEE